MEAVSIRQMLILGGGPAAQGRAGRAHFLREVSCHFRDRITQINGMAQQQSKVTVEPFRC
jgi:hypothetical protein